MRNRGLYQNLGENQIKEIIDTARASVFFVDEDQRVTLKDIGEKSEIRRWAEQCGAEPVVLGLAGASFLFYGSVTLIVEARLAVASLRAEMDFIWRLGKHYAPAELADRHSPHYRLRVKPRA